MRQLEKKFEKQAVKDLRELPNSFVPLKLEATSVRGQPDILFCLAGKYCALEFKRDKAEMNKKTGRGVLQRHNLEKIKSAGGFARFTYPGNWEQTLKELKEFCNV